MTHADIIAASGLTEADLADGPLAVFTPVDGSEIARLKPHNRAEANAAITKAHDAFLAWRKVPAPRRGEFVRLLGEELRREKDALGALVTLECGKILQEGLGEVQEMIDICDFAVGLSRQLYGLTIASERPGHAMRETWHPMGVCGVITAFNFPVAPWCWNAALALVCGDPVIWKPSEKTPLTALAVQRICDRVSKAFGGDAPDGLTQVLIGERDLGETLTANPKVAIISATGSVPMGRAVAADMSKRLGRTILELGGNNAMIVAPSADLEMALCAIVFSAVGTAGQRCTSLRRLIVHEDIYDALIPRLIKAYEGLPIGDPLAAGTLVGPLIDQDASAAMTTSLDKAKAEGGVVHGGAKALTETHGDAAYVHPAIVEMPAQTAIMHHETFAPILYVVKYRDLAEAIGMQNAVPQGLSSCIFSTDLRETEEFLSAAGSDCGIANVNIGPSGAEIGGAFGGEKDTGGGRESGSDAWKGYMRRQTNTINYSRELPLAQGIKFDI
ncbi:Succinate-semialdehyde dehydrogenase [NADP(+)] [Thalassovita gelatinovora]|uniref:aldehyde dehydrogenase (NAD(+)) n=1 Tax=Thalassovita gelatinovora TaxID=53501 RepID=A0A0P1F911_THAGE|nr:aldehyde dehydrogenase family protein [Thalassovita gelatinovora]QIZ81336.1 aldehyde dehydrogenase family protein [Thalassovita gelatinovora]CUH64484.1 Succinate-semialdehyde dehydrogenase [NADP(+)] [Thalassovita gelatinovora]SEP97719.1 aldehyde dehydrogenase (NAD+) [Thalassovita gelatinovora]